METVSINMPKELELKLNMNDSVTFERENKEYCEMVVSSETDYFMEIIEKESWAPLSGFLDLIGFKPDIETTHYGWVKDGEDIFWSIDWETRALTIKAYFLEV